MEEKKDKYIIFDSVGGHGKQILALPVINALKKKYPERKIIVTTSWDGPFFHNPDIHRFYLHGQAQYFFDDYVNEDTMIFKHDVYNTEDYILKRKHIVEAWCNLCGVEYEGQKPVLYINPREYEIAYDKIKPDQGKPIMLLQTHGGGPKQYSKKSWARDMPMHIAQAIVQRYSKDYRILHIRRPDQPEIKGIETLSLPLRELYAVFLLSKKRVFMDSFSQHVAAALNLQSTVLWIANKPEIIGHPDLHINVLPEKKYAKEFNKFSYLEQFDISGQVQQYPFDTLDIFNFAEIVDSIEKQR